MRCFAIGSRQRPWREDREQHLAEVAVCRRARGGMERQDLQRSSCSRKCHRRLIRDTICGMDSIRTRQILDYECHGDRPCMLT